jgi:hypothetical protein
MTDGYERQISIIAAWPVSVRCELRRFAARAPAKMGRRRRRPNIPENMPLSRYPTHRHKYTPSTTFAPSRGSRPYIRSRRANIPAPSARTRALTTSVRESTPLQRPRAPGLLLPRQYPKTALTPLLFPCPQTSLTKPRHCPQQPTKTPPPSRASR